MNNKYDIDNIVYISDTNKVIECKIIEITKTSMSITYKLKSKDFHTYYKQEHEVFENKEQTDNYIRKLHHIEKINKMNIEICDYQDWVSDLDFAIQHYEECETDIEIHLQSNQTNGREKKLFAVINRGSKTLLENIKKYFKEELNKREKELEKLKKKEYNTNI